LELDDIGEGVMASSSIWDIRRY